MSLSDEIGTLRCWLYELAAEADASLESRYAVRFPPPEQVSIYIKVRRYVGRKLREWGLRRTPPPEPWLVTLRHVPGPDDARPVLVWALGTQPGELRPACQNLKKIFDQTIGYAPVLVTDVADFAFYSRLGWLVEYVPDFPDASDSYARCKQRYLARRYRDAPAVPVAAGLRPDLSFGDLDVG
jgi:hypothetical protein